jgi:4-alpha-glucanotransferase
MHVSPKASRATPSGKHPVVNFQRRGSGIQLHITSLSQGKLGPDAYRFVDWLAAAGQSWWQMLPLSPPDPCGSPYKAASAFAAWPGLLEAPDAPVSDEQAARVRAREADWIEDWLAFAGTDALADQVRFDREWTKLRDYAHERGVQLLGDVAIYVAPDGADHRMHPELFQTGAVAGAPPDAFSDAGQLWGNPLYDWSALRAEGFGWWVERLRRTLSLFDAARLDHFRGFVAYWAVPEGDADARRGRWRRGPGRALFDAFRERLGADLPLVAEDLGVITPPVERLREQLGLPGMLVIEFGFGPGTRNSPHRLANHVENRVVYTGTHDHDTARGWYQSLDPAVRAEVDEEAREVGVAEPEPWWSVIRLALSSPARTCMLQAQDILGLGSEARMNDPSRAGGNWRWRMREGALTDALARRLRDATQDAGRLARP